MNRFADLPGFNTTLYPDLPFLVGVSEDGLEPFCIEWGFIAFTDLEQDLIEVSDLDDFFCFVEVFNENDLMRFSGSPTNFQATWRKFVHDYTLQFNSSLPRGLSTFN